MRVYVSLGSNLGDGVSQIRQALERLQGAGCKVLGVSSFYRTEPVGVRDQPWFVNCVAELDTDLSPRALLRTAKAIENAMGRRRTLPGAPRPIDIDILLYENQRVELPSLTVPHPQLSERRFVLVPLNELAPEMQHPVSGKTVSEMLRKTPDRGKVVRIRQRSSLNYEL